MNGMDQNVKILNNILEAEVKQNPNAPINILKFVTNYTLDVISETAMGVNVNSQSKSENIYARALEKYVKKFINKYFIYKHCSNILKL
jgi:outer membrane receptor for ferric coprogen and ferric-rhodotorulic acid